MAGDNYEPNPIQRHRLCQLLLFYPNFKGLGDIGAFRNPIWRKIIFQILKDGIGVEVNQHSFARLDSFITKCSSLEEGT